LVSVGDELKRGLVENVDFILLPESVHKFIIELYGGGPALGRRVQAKASGQCYIDLYPVRIQVYTCEKHKQVDWQKPYVLYAATNTGITALGEYIKKSQMTAHVMSGMSVRCWLLCDESETDDSSSASAASAGATGASEAQTVSGSQKGFSSFTDALLRCSEKGTDSNSGGQQDGDDSLHKRAKMNEDSDEMDTASGSMQLGAQLQSTQELQQQSSLVSLRFLTSDVTDVFFSPAPGSLNNEGTANSGTSGTISTSSKVESGKNTVKWQLVRKNFPTGTTVLDLLGTREVLHVLVEMIRAYSPLDGEWPLNKHIQGWKSASSLRRGDVVDAKDGESTFREAIVKSVNMTGK
jgi:hypothetical protein